MFKNILILLFLINLVSGSFFFISISEKNQELELRELKHKQEIQINAIKTACQNNMNKVYWNAIMTGCKEI